MGRESRAKKNGLNQAPSTPRPEAPPPAQPPAGHRAPLATQDQRAAMFGEMIHAHQSATAIRVAVAKRRANPLELQVVQRIAPGTGLASSISCDDALREAQALERRMLMMFDGLVITGARALEIDNLPQLATPTK